MAHQKNTFRMDSLRDSMHAGKSFESEMNHEKTPKKTQKKNILHPLCFIQSGSSALVNDIISSLHVVMHRLFI